MEFVFEKAKESDFFDVLNLYKSVIGNKFSAWDETYPSETEINGDLAADSLFLLKKDGKIIGACSVVPENELDYKTCWNVSEKAKEIARVVIHPDYQGKGYSRVLVSNIIDELRKIGCKSIHLSTPTKNIPAQKNYFSLGFEIKEECDLYGSRFFLLEKIL